MKIVRNHCNREIRMLYRYGVGVKVESGDLFGSQCVGVLGCRCVYMWGVCMQAVGNGYLQVILCFFFVFVFVFFF